ncbi:MAG: GDSL-type esterase/lipase family protein [Firmicutes bacterium]|nr:GDSL-type esterase/lipase family protein [Bacillota bacterium]
MTPLEIVLVCVLGVGISVAVIFLLVINANRTNRIDLFHAINRSAITGQTVFFGDSLTDFFPISEFFPGKVIYNRGITGDTTEQLLGRIDTVTAIRPKAVFLQIGTNDLNKNKKPSEIVKNIMLISDKLKAELPDAKIRVISLYPISRNRKVLSTFTCQFRTNKNINMTNALLQNACVKKGLDFIDIHPLLATEKGSLKNEYTIEGLHLSEKGYEVVAKALRPYLD